MSILAYHCQSKTHRIIPLAATPLRQIFVTFKADVSYQSLEGLSKINKPIEAWRHMP